MHSYILPGAYLCILSHAEVKKFTASLAGHRWKPFAGASFPKLKS